MHIDIKGYNRQNLCLVRRAKRLWRPGSASMIYRPPYRRRIVLASNAKATCFREQSMKTTSATLRAPQAGLIGISIRFGTPDAMAAWRVGAISAFDRFCGRGGPSRRQAPENQWRGQ